MFEYVSLSPKDTPLHPKHKIRSKLKTQNEIFLHQ